MDLNDLRLKGFLTSSKSNITDELIEEFGELCKEALKKHFEETHGDFTLRMSNIGRPSCQLQMAKSGAKPEATDYAHALRMMQGNILEALIITLMKAAGCNIENVQEKVSLQLGTEEIFGSYDVLLDGKIWDVKTASAWSYSNKFLAGYDKIKQMDDFGYIAQGFGYAAAKGVPFGGWIVLNKSSGEIAFVPAPDDPEEQARALEEARKTVTKVAKDHPFERCFEAEEETFNGTKTGDKVLGKTCGFCDYKWSCWPGLTHEPNRQSKAKNPEWRYYTTPKKEEDIEEDKKEVSNG